MDKYSVARIGDKSEESSVTSWSDKNTGVSHYNSEQTNENYAEHSDCPAVFDTPLPTSPSWHWRKAGHRP